MNCVIKLFLVLEIVFYFFNIEVATQNSTCITTYTNLSIYGNDLNGVLGSASDCCQLCQQKRGCRAYTWDSFNGGTCWLKNTTQPLGRYNGSVTGILKPYPNETYSLNQTYAAPNFFDTWHFDLWDLTNITKNVNKTTAEQLGMIGYQNGKVYIGLDHTNVYNTSGRPSIQVQTNYLYNSGLFILSLEHMPTGSTVWPAFWSTGPDWPNHGEIDVLEGVPSMDFNQVNIHVGKNCIMRLNESVFFTGSMNNPEHKPILDCYQYSEANATDNKGCSVHTESGTFNTGFNKAGGGVFALQWDRERFLRVWNFVQPNIPTDIAQESPNPNPDNWGLPSAQYTLGPDCTPDHFSNQTMMFDIALCGSWVAENYPGGEAACENTVKFHPEEFTEAYWLINYLKVFCKPNEPCGFFEPQCEFGC